MGACAGPSEAGTWAGSKESNAGALFSTLNKKDNTITETQTRAILFLNLPLTSRASVSSIEPWAGRGLRLDGLEFF